MSHIDNNLDVNVPIAEKTESGEIKASVAFEEYLHHLGQIAEPVTDAVPSTVLVTSASATDLATVITLSNEIKVDVNTLVTDLNNAITQVNLLLSNLRTSRKLDE